MKLLMSSVQTDHKERERETDRRYTVVWEIFIADFFCYFCLLTKFEQNFMHYDNMLPFSFPYFDNTGRASGL